MLIQDLPKLYNKRKERLKCTLIQHSPSSKDTKEPPQNSKDWNKQCVVYLHGLGSSRLEALHIAQALPKQYCFCMFDLSGSGKSEGEFITYGLKEQEDIGKVKTIQTLSCSTCTRRKKYRLLFFGEGAWEQWRLFSTPASTTGQRKAESCLTTLLSATQWSEAVLQQTVRVVLR